MCFLIINININLPFIIDSRDYSWVKKSYSIWKILEWQVRVNNKTCYLLSHKKNLLMAREESNNS